MSKEREAFNLWWEGNAIAMMCEEDEAFKIWQAAKAQAVPEGFVLVSIETLDECLNWAHVAKWDSPSKKVENEIEHHELIIESIIKAQHPSSTSGCSDEP